MAAIWKQSITTNAGIALMNKAYGVSSIIPTKAVTITDDISGYSVTQVMALTSVNYNQSRVPIVVSNQANTTRIGIDIDNKDVNEQYDYYGIGVYFKQVSTGEEVLFSVIPLTGAATIIPNQSGVATSSISIDSYTSIVPGTKVDLTVSDSGSVTRSDVEQIVASNQSYSFPKKPADFGIDLYTLKSIGIYQIKDDKTVVNAPDGFSGNGYITVIGDGTTANPITQDLFDTVTGNKYSNSYYSDGNKWNGWNETSTNKYADDGDAKTLTSAKAYTDTKVSGKADDSAVVHTADMRKPASDVAGIEEVNAKQDKIGYTPADDSKVVHNSGDETIGGTKTFTNPIKGTINGITYQHSAAGDDLNTSYMNDSVIYTGTNGVAHAPAGTNGTWAIVRNYNSDTTNGAQSYYDTNQGELYVRTRNSNSTYTPWIKVADDSKVMHTTGAEEIAGQKTFDVAPIDKTTGNPYITAKAPGVPKLEVKYNATSEAFDYTLTAPDKDGLSDITQYNLLWKDHSVDDWTTVIVKPDALTGQLIGVGIAKTYDFKASAQNAVGSSDFTDVITLQTVDGNIYGVSWDGSSSGFLQRTDAAVGLKAGINGAQNDFDTRGPWRLMDKTVTDSYGNAFVRVPKFYIRKTQDKSKPLSTWQVSLVKQGDDWYLPNCFYDFDNKKELNYVDVSRYEGSIISGKLQSKTGVTPTASQTIVQLRSSAVANNTDGKKGYHLWDVHTLDMLQVLFTIEFATLDSQSIMKGITDNVLSGASNTGAADSVEGTSGNVNVSNGYGAMTYRGIENLYGNLAMWTDGLNINNLSLYSCDDATKYASDTFTNPYYKVSYLLSSGNGNITGLGFDEDHLSVEAPTYFNSDPYNTYYHDYGYVNGSGNYVVYTGGSWNWYAGYSGLWYWYGYNSSPYAYSNVGSRLLKKAL